MYTSIHISNFRSLDDVKLEGLKRINLFVGRNNAGKTSLLEAIFLLGGATIPSLATTLGYLRGQRLDPSRPDPDPLWRPLFGRLDPSKQIELRGQRLGEPSERRVRITADMGQGEDITPDTDGIARAGQELPEEVPAPPDAVSKPRF